MRGSGGMTVEEIKKLDRRFAEVADPLNTGFPKIKKIIQETAEKYGTTALAVMRQYVNWKWSKS